jgi:hypothetical protein
MAISPVLMREYVCLYVHSIATCKLLLIPFLLTNNSMFLWSVYQHQSLNYLSQAKFRIWIYVHICVYVDESFFYPITIIRILYSIFLLFLSYAMYCANSSVGGMLSKAGLWPWYSVQHIATPTAFLSRYQWMCIGLLHFSIFLLVQNRQTYTRIYMFVFFCVYLVRPCSRQPN